MDNFKSLFYCEYLDRTFAIFNNSTQDSLHGKFWPTTQVAACQTWPVTTQARTTGRRIECDGLADRIRAHRSVDGHAETFARGAGYVVRRVLFTCGAHPLLESGEKIALTAVKPRRKEGRTHGAPEHKVREQ